MKLRNTHFLEESTVISIIKDEKDKPRWLNNWKQFQTKWDKLRIIQILDFLADIKSTILGMNELSYYSRLRGSSVEFGM